MRGHGARRALISPLSKRLGQALEGRGQRAAGSRVRASAAAPCGASVRGSPALAPAKPRSLRTFPWGGPRNSRTTPAARGAAAGRSCAGASCSRRGWLRSSFPPAPGSPAPSTCSETQSQRHHATAAPRDSAAPPTQLGVSTSHTSHDWPTFKSRTLKTSG